MLHTQLLDCFWVNEVFICNVCTRATGRSESWENEARVAWRVRTGHWNFFPLSNRLKKEKENLFPVPMMGGDKQKRAKATAAKGWNWMLEKKEKKKKKSHHKPSNINNSKSISFAQKKGLEGWEGITDLLFDFFYTCRHRALNIPSA